jgi:ATP-dependent DNA helicase RecG
MCAARRRRRSGPQVEGWWSPGAHLPRRDAARRRQTAGRRQLARRRRAGDALLLRFLHFYPSQQKALAPGRGCACAASCAAASSAARWCTRRSRPAGAPLPQALTPVYPTSAQLPQAYLRKAVASALGRAPLHELLPARWCRRGCRRCATR